MLTLKKKIIIITIIIPLPLAFETFGPLNEDEEEFLSTLGKRISAITGDKRESCFLRQRLSICIQRFNSVCVKGTLSANLDLLNV